MNGILLFNLLLILYILLQKGKQSQRLLVSPAKLTIKRVFSTLKKIATTTGGSVSIVLYRVKS